MKKIAGFKNIAILLFIGLVGFVFGNYTGQESGVKYGCAKTAYTLFSSGGLPILETTCSRIEGKMIVNVASLFGPFQFEMETGMPYPPKKEKKMPPAPPKPKPKKDLDKEFE